MSKQAAHKRGCSQTDAGENSTTDSTISTAPVNFTSRYAFALLHHTPEPRDFHVHAQTRPDLCETTPYMRAYQGGVHKDSKTQMIGYLLDACAAPGDVWADEGRFIVSHGGGASAKAQDVSDGVSVGPTRHVPTEEIKLPRNPADLFGGYSMFSRPPNPSEYRVLNRDQHSSDRGIKILLDAMEMNSPVCLIVGADYKWWPFDMRTTLNHHGLHRRNSPNTDVAKYVVLGWYLVRHSWAEPEPGYTKAKLITPLYKRWKFAFHWIKDQGVPWWIPELEKVARLNPISDNTHTRRQESPCLPINSLSQRCRRCKFKVRRIYHEGWFCTRTTCPSFGLMCDGRGSWEVTLSYSHDFVYGAGLPPVAPRHVENFEKFVDTTKGGPWSVVPRFSKSLATYKKEHWQGRCCSRCGRLSPKIHWSLWICDTCTLLIEESPMKIYSAREINASVDLLNAPFEVQWPVTQQFHLSDQGEMVNAFVLPDGGSIFLVKPRSTSIFDEMFEEYQQQAASRDMFRRCPLKASYVCGQFTNHFLHNGGVHYNFSCDVITESFKDGPSVVAKAKKLLEATVTRILGRETMFNEVLSCAYKMDQSMGYHCDNEFGIQPTIAAVSLGAPAVMLFRKRIGRGQKEWKKCLEITLVHGDILIMDGDHIQMNYEHRVLPRGLRFAATARLILPEKCPTPAMKPTHRWKRQASIHKAKYLVD